MKLSDSPARVIGVAPILVQSITNLFSNAVKFVRPGTTPVIVVTAEKRGSTVRVTVRDNGIGIALEHRERVFRVFERLHDARLYPGTGVGLALVKRAVAKMGGELGFESTVGEGSAFWIELPAAPQ